MSHVTGCTCADEGRCLTCHCSPAEPTTAEAFATVRELLSVLSVEKIDGVGKFYAARDAIALLERRMQEMPGQTFNMLWPVVKPWLKPGSADLVHDEMIKALPSN